jgi:hypothetical protein
VSTFGNNSAATFANVFDSGIHGIQFTLPSGLGASENSAIGPKRLVFEQILKLILYRQRRLRISSISGPGGFARESTES